jgi:hypothetical protein
MASIAGVVNTALELIASQTTITALNDGTPQANAAQTIYAPVVQLLLREIDPDFARLTAALSLSSAGTPVPPWAFEYLYPADCLRLRQVRPAVGSYNVNDPLPVRSVVAFDIISAVNTKVILTNQASALAVYTSSTPTEAQWDSVFAEAVARRLANPLAMALSGRPDFARQILEEAAAVASTAEGVDDGAKPLMMAG